LNTLDLLNAIGEVDDFLVKSAKTHQKSHRNVFAVIASAAACFLLLFILPIVFISMHGVNSSENETTQVDQSSVQQPVFSIVRIDVSSSEDQWSFVEYASLKSIYERILFITESHEPDDSATSTGINSESVNPEMVHGIESVPSKITKPSEDSVPEQSMTAEEQFLIELTHSNGQIYRYNLKGNTLIDLETGIKYNLTTEEAEALRTFLH